MKRVLVYLTVWLCVLSIVSSVSAAERIKIGFIVKQPDESWFQDEWKYSDQAARQFGFDVIKIGGTDGEKVLNGIDNLAIQGARGFIICTPDVKLGPAIAAKARANRLKLMSVDDRFIGPKGAVMEDVHHVGISASNIGSLAGRTIVNEAKARGWNLKNVGFLRMSFDSLPTIKERTDGATAALLAAGLPKARIFDSPMKTLDVEGSFNAANITITKHPDITLWIVVGGNDNSVLGAIRALEGHRFRADSAIGVGINGTEAVAEFQKKNKTAFIATILLNARQHGYDTAKSMFLWIRDGKEPPKITWTAGTVMTRKNYKSLMGLK
ncbi:MAG: sugar ABC transporter substrate-binding protein [Deltaproteobacteria bacterium HGW-Deltaproteobacteria-19]|jgi:L-arabinose transport system substrate-binding protein|nr:MAG: sugar ABC transporter substrate-binding protein [Deltaproteobacteria bacterium HGW-Deltaproteobacteria-19]